MVQNCCIFGALRNFAEYSDEANYLVVCLGSSCTSAVERSPHNIKIVGLIPTEYRSFSPSIQRNVSFDKSLEEVQHYYNSHLLKNECLVWGETSAINTV